MKTKKSAILVTIVSLFALVGCNNAEPTPTVVTTYTDKTENSIYGKLSDFSIAAKDVKEGDTLTFKATPSQYFDVAAPTNNGEPCTLVRNNDDGSAIYSTTIVKGPNNLKGVYNVQKDIDFVDEYKLDISDELFDYVIGKKKSGEKDDGKTVEADKRDLDFRKSGIEQCRAPLKFNDKHEKVSSGEFVNYVDGDTTHVETYNLSYTVKIRYLSIDTPESTSELEEWGLTASYYSKYIFTGDVAEGDDYKKYIESSTDFTGVQAGVTSIILMSQEASIHSNEMTLENVGLNDIKASDYAATTDGNQRNLAYLWYATVENPTKDDFRCLNLEMVYQGFSFGVGSIKDTSEKIYRIFDAANLSAQANKRHIFSDMPDDNYYYYESEPAQEMTLADLYDTAPKDNVIGYLPESPLCDKKTLYKISGYVSRKVGTSFYIQEKASYTREEVLGGKAFGLYVFTFSETPIRAGDYVTVIGALSSYGGTFQMQGITFHTLNPNPARDTIIDSTKSEKVTPVKLTGAEFNSLKLPQILVEITDNLYFYNFENTFNGKLEPLGEGGSEEINKYNEAYPFYNTSNSPIVYASYGDVDDAAALNDSTKGTSTGVRYSDKVIRISVNADVLVSYGIETAYSYKFFTGGSYYFNRNGAEYANMDDDNPYKSETIENTFKRKMIVATGEGNHGLVVISSGYESTSGNKKMSATICSGSQKDIILTEVEG